MLSSIAENQDRPDADAAIASDFAPLLLLIGSTPRRINNIDPGTVDSTLEATRQTLAAIQFDDFASQLEAMISHDVSRHHGYDMTRTAESMRANMLVVFSRDDHVVTHFPAESFAKTAGAKILSVPSECGHGVTGCELTNIGKKIRFFLTRHFDDVIDGLMMSNHLYGL